MVGVCFEPRSLYYFIELEVYIPYFDGNKNVEEYLDWRLSLIKLLRNTYWMNILECSFFFTKISKATLCDVIA